ncbi:hypothetical protein TVAG_185220 [Trichomonas vaginalis G3]|uniref:Uncharacterized protein n=1 Tax=Trichomonas vaginalis (strain ATCC PRA-98 / G3) TaxID=412133 RepID=A2D8G7_TRIV3|nr:papain family cysteine protease domain containing protein family [Trichomonas vaginalis G3]EAY23216.1 hypothetical protein TVAG_185220 [Trichomonas vaginalis G3]KAI5534135.1 papain family cysteine protease domain containing protein family [Trichomonas vaginalis G3]|eukprot:XP_001584202.1 hypothetical protein [Trichomonas vaginalis G3]
MIYLPRKTYFQLLVLGISSLIFSILTLCFSSYIFSISKKPQQTSLPFITGKPLPSKYLIDGSVMSPVFDQGPRGTCYLFQIISILESQYKKQGLRNGYLQENEYLKLSVEGLAYKMVQLCQQYPNSPPCINSPRLLNTSDAGSLSEFLDFVDYFPEFKKYVVPANCCVYQQKPQNEMICPNIDNCIKNNPIEFNILRRYYTQNIEDTKQWLYQLGLPSGFSITMPQQRYIFPCSNRLVNNSLSCLNRDFRCPDDPREFCSIEDFKLFKASDAEFIFHKTGRTVPGTGHAMTLVGYNDNFSPKMTYNFTGRSPQTGGFIIKNSWGSRGHTYEYLLDMMTEDQDAMYCPDKDNVMRWIPASYECIKQYRDGDKCSLDTILTRGKRIMKSSDTLKCVNKTHCDVNSTYYLLRESSSSLSPSIVWSKYGVPLSRVIRVKGNDSPVIETIETLPIQHLYYAFQLRDDLIEPPVEGKCGYVMFFYDDLLDMKKMTQGQSRGYFIVQGVDVEFTKTSFKGSGSRLNYTLVDRSISTYKEIDSRDPLDFTELL